MKRMMALVLVMMFAALPCIAGTVITYEYDPRHRLVQADYSESEKATYSYDAANNLDLYIAITDSKYYRSFLLWFAKAKRTIERVIAEWERGGEVNHGLRG